MNRRAGAWVLALCAGACSEDPCLEPEAGWVCALAGTGEQAFNRDGLDARRTHLYLVSAVRPGPDGLVYLVDFNNQRLRRIEPTGLMSTVAGNGFHALAAAGELATDSPLENPIDFAFLDDGRLAFVSYHDPRVLVIDAAGQIDVLAGTGDVGARGDEGDFESPLSAQFIQLDGIAIGPDDTIYVSDSLANRVRVIRDGTIRSLAGTGSAAYRGDGGPAIDATLNWPTALELDNAGNLFVADTRNHVVRRISTDGTIDTIAGTGERGFGGDGGPAAAAMLDQPNGLAIGGDGTLYVADRGNFRVRRITPDGTIDTIAGTGEQGLRGDGGPATAAQFGYIARIALDGDRLLVADQSNACARYVVLR